MNELIHRHHVAVEVRHDPERREFPSRHSKCGIAGTVMRGGGSGAILEALPMPLGSAITLLSPPGFAGPGGIPLIGEFPAPASPAIIPNEAVGAARKTKNARASFAEVLDTKGAPLFDESFGYMKPMWVCPSAGAIKLDFRTADPKACWQSCTRSELRSSPTRVETQWKPSTSIPI